MRILTFSNCPLEASQGSGYVILGYAQGLRDRGHDLELMGPESLTWPPWPSPGIRYRQMLGMAVVALRRAGRGYDVFEFYGGEAWLAISLLRRRARRPLLVAHSNGLETLVSRHLRAAGGARRRWYQFDLSRFYERAFRGADGLVTVSDFDRSFATVEGYQPAERAAAIDNPLPNELLDQPPPGDRPNRVVFCGSWIPRKGTDLMRRDCAQFLIEHPAWSLLLIGVGPAFSTAEAFPADVRGRVEVVPYADRVRDLPKLFGRCAIAIQPSLYESFGLTAAEAMASGCALIATRVGFAASLHHEAEALLLPSAGSPHLLEALRRLANDSPLRHRIACGGQCRVQTLRWSAACDRLDTLYRTWSQERRTRPGQGTGK